jgi:thiol-disulfide isomerase/thioredoxin
MKSPLTLKTLVVAFVWQLVSIPSSFSQATYKLKAHITGLNSSSIIIRYARQGVLFNDTVSVHQSQFSHAIAQTDGAIATLVLSPSIQFPFWLESSLVSITGTLGSSPNLTCTGTPENDLFDVYRQTIERPYSFKKQGKQGDEQDRIVLQENKATRQFIEQHPSSLTAAYLLYWQAVYDTTIFDQLDQLLAKLVPSVKNSFWAQKTITRMYNFRNRPRVGKKLPAFNLPDAAGKQVTLNSFKGKYVLIDFWGTWCVPCLQGIPELKALYAKYGNRLTVLSIAWERAGDRDKWVKAIDKYGMIWPQVAEFTSEKASVIELYNVKEYPTLLLADPDGILLAKIKYGEPLEDKVQQLLAK